MSVSCSSLTVVAPLHLFNHFHRQAESLRTSDAFDIGPVGHNDHGLVEDLVRWAATNASIPLPEPERKTAQRSGASAEAMRPRCWLNS